MEVDASADPAALPVAIVEDDQANWEAEKVEIERVQFNLNKDLTDLRERLEEVTKSNEKMAGELNKHSAEIREHIDRHRILETTRNELTDKNLELETVIARLKIEKEERDAAVAAANRDARTAISESIALKDQLKQLTSEKTTLSQSMEAFQYEKQSIEFERQKYAAERDLTAEAKRWLMQEVSERDNKVSSLRLELSNRDIQGANERLQFQQQINLLNAQVGALNEKIDMLQFNNADLAKRLENTELAKHSEIINLENEIRCQTELQRVMKNSMEEAKNAADQFKDELEARDNVLVEVRKVLQESQEDMERDNLSHAEAMKEKDEELARTRAELAKVNEMIKSMSDVKLNVSEEELAELAPAAAETVRYLRGGESLSSLVLEHARTCGELREVKEENANLRNTLEELLEAIREKQPHLVAQREFADELFDRNGRFEKQLELADSERKDLLSQRDNAQRDLGYLRAELEKYQRDYEFVTKRNAELMYAVERQSRMQDPNWSEQADEQLFHNIVQLQKRNVELEADIENAKASAAQAAINAQSEEMAQLRADLSVTKKSESELKVKVEQTKAAFDSLKEKTEMFKELVRDSVTATEAKTARLRAEEAVAARMAAEATIERLRTQYEETKASYERREKELEQRIQSTEANINNVTETNIKLNAMLDAQKTNTAAMEKEFTTALKEKEAALGELRTATASGEEKERKLVELGRQTLEATDQAGSLRVKVRVLEDDLNTARSELTSLRTMAEGQRVILNKEEQVRNSVVELANFLSRAEAANSLHTNTQIETLRIERESLKSSATRLSDQLTHARNDAKLTQQRLEKELEVVRSRLSEKEEQIGRNDMELVDLRSKLSQIQNQYTASDASGMTPDRLRREYMQLKTRSQFLESELDEARRKLLEAETTQKRMDAEHAISASHNTVLEENLKQSEQMGSIEKERLIANAKCFEDRAQQLTEQLTQNQTELNELRNKLDEQSFNAETEANELRRQLQVASLNLEGVKRDLELANNSILSLKNDATRNASALEQHTSIVRQFEDRISEMENGRLRLQAELNNKAAALVAETTAKNEADQMKEHFERLLRRKTEEMTALEDSCNQKQAEYDEKLHNLSQQYESLSSNAGSASQMVDLTEGIEGGAHSKTIESLQSLLQFHRQSRDEAVTRAMNAEVETRRLRAETTEFERLKNELIQKIRDLETEKIATAASLVDRAQLIEKVESLSAVHNLNNQLTEERAKLQVQLAQIQKTKADTDKQVSVLSAKIDEQNLKIASSNQEAARKNREIEQLKRNQTGVRGPNAIQQSQIEKLRGELNAARQEAQTANEQLKAANEAAREKQAESNKKFNQTRQLALKYREESAKYKKILDGVPGDNDPATSRLTAQANIHAEEVAKLNSEIEKLKAESSNTNMTTFRMKTLESSLKSKSEEIINLKQQIEKLLEKNKQLTESQSVSATDVESKSQTSTSSQPVEPTQNPCGAKRPSFGNQTATQSTSSSNIVPPAPEPTNTVQQHQQQQPRISPVKRPVPPSIPNELMDIIPPVPSDNIPGKNLPTLDVVPDPTPPTTNTFGSMLPVPHTFQSSVRVPTQSLFSSSSTTTVQPQPEKKTILPNIDSAPTTPGGNVTTTTVTTTSSLNPSQLFGNSSAPPTNITTTSSADTLLLPEESVVEGAAGQSSLVSGSVDQQKNNDVELVANDSESRDSTNTGGVSSSDGRRKRTASDFELSDAKRQRESPNETVTSSDPRQQVAEIPELDDDDGVLVIEQEVSDEDPNDTTIQERNQEVIDLENDEEVMEDEMEGEEEDDDSFGNDEEFEERVAPEEEDDDDCVVISDGDDDGPEEEGNDAESMNDAEDDENDDDIEEIEMGGNNDDVEEVIGGEDSQPSLDDQDREAASAVEEAEDEGRDPLNVIDEPNAPADPTGAAAGIGNSARESQRIRLPTGLRDAEREDQCSSSNETNEERPEQRVTARNAARLQRPMRGSKPTRGVYMPGRGGRGRGGGTA